METHQDFPEVKGKIVDTVEFTADETYYALTIRFQDKTSLTFPIEPSVVTLPVYSEWIEGEEKIVKRYEPIREFHGPRHAGTGRPHGTPGQAG